MSVPAGAAAPPRTPALAFALGLSGLIPFWALAIAMATGWPRGFPRSELDGMLATYAATILAFLGGIRWGAALRAPERAGVATDYVFGVTPQLFGWGALFLPAPFEWIALGVGVLILGPIDRNLVERGLAPAWFGRLRLILSLGAGAALFVAALT